MNVVRASGRTTAKGVGGGGHHPQLRLSCLTTVGIL